MNHGKTLWMMLLVCGVLASMAAADIVTVSAKAKPWETTVNPAYNYGIGGGAGPEVIEANEDMPFDAGDTITFTYVSGQTKFNGSAGWSPYDAAGVGGAGNARKGSTQTYFPSYHIPSDQYPAWLMALVGTFADDAGVIVGVPFNVGNGPTTVTVPAGATRVQLGLNDDKHEDNIGSLDIEYSYVPEPATMCILAMGGLAVIRRRRK
jgi:hypothetical protein